MNEQGPILTVKEAARLLKISDRAMYNWIHIEGFPALKVGSCIRIPYDRLMEWVNENVGRTVKL